MVNWILKKYKNIDDIDIKMNQLFAVIINCMCAQIFGKNIFRDEFFRKNSFPNSTKYIHNEKEHACFALIISTFIKTFIKRIQFGKYFAKIRKYLDLRVR